MNWTTEMERNLIKTVKKAVETGLTKLDGCKIFAKNFNLSPDAVARKLWKLPEATSFGTPQRRISSEERKTIFSFVAKRFAETGKISESINSVADDLGLGHSTVGRIYYDLNKLQSASPISEPQKSVETPLQESPSPAQEKAAIVSDEPSLEAKIKAISQDVMSLLPLLTSNAKLEEANQLLASKDKEIADLKAALASKEVQQKNSDKTIQQLRSINSDYEKKFYDLNLFLGEFLNLSPVDKIVSLGKVTEKAVELTGGRDFKKQVG